MPAQQPLDSRHTRLTHPNPSGQFQFSQDQLRRAARIFPLHIQDQLLQISGKNPAPVAIRARSRLECFQAAVAVLVEPFLQRLVSDVAGSPVMILIGLLGELLQRRA